jgi:RNase P subunit RPR2
MTQVLAFCNECGSKLTPTSSVQTREDSTTRTGYMYYCREDGNSFRVEIVQTPTVREEAPSERSTG